MEKFKPNQVLYTKGYLALPDGTEVTVSHSHAGGDIISVTTSLKKVHFIESNLLTTVKPVSISIPQWLKQLGATTLWVNRTVHVYGFSKVPDGKTLSVAEGYVHTDVIPDVRCVDSITKQIFVVPKENIYVQNTNTTTTTTVVRPPLAKDYTEFTEDHLYMMELLKEKTRDGVIDKVMRGVNIEDYEIIKSSKYFVIVPKNPETLYMPMIMAHTDIVHSVRTPTDDNLEYEPTTDKFSSPTGLGADDRAGCYAINRILKNHAGKFIVALFDEEEIGCLGSKAFAESADFPRVNRLSSCYISIDRRRGSLGASQIATYSFDNKELFDLVKLATGRDVVQGSSTDCRALSAKSYELPASPGQTKLACFNMSCGYDNEHTHREVLFFTELQRVVSDFDALVDLAYDLWEQPYAATKPTYVNTGKSKKSSSNWWDKNEITIKGETYDDKDLLNLLWIYQQYTGKAYKFASAQSHIIDPEVMQYARLNPNCAPNGIYAGVKLPQDAYDMLSSYTWVVQKISPTKQLCDLTSECGTKKASNVPYAFLSIITIEDILIETKE